MSFPESGSTSSDPEELINLPISPNFSNNHIHFDDLDLPVNSNNKEKVNHKFVVKKINKMCG